MNMGIKEEGMGKKGIVEQQDEMGILLKKGIGDKIRI